MPEENAKSSSAATPPAMRSVDHGKRQFIIAPRRGSQALTAGVRPMSGAAARALVGQAERDLRNTVVYAPFDGRIVGVTTSVGQIVGPVKALFTLIDTSQWYVVADFRETELEQIHPGERVMAYVMVAPSVRLS